jgi:phosphoglycerate dehydrogenase-like enzyme
MTKTKNLITIKELRMMKNSAIIVNLAEGYNQQADLAWAIDEDVIAGAALMYMKKEPLP